MPGQAIAIIGSQQWRVSLATTPDELARGLGGLASMPAGTGMLFDMGREQHIAVTTAPMLFPLDIVFLNGSLVVNGLAHNVAPVFLVSTEVPARYFLEVNAGEAQGIQKGQQATVQALVVPTQTPAQSLVNSVFALAPFALFMGAMTGLVKKFLPKSEVKWQPGVVVMPRLPAEARGDFLFYEYIRDLVRMGESISDEEARLMWEDWERAGKRKRGPLFREKQPYLPQTESIVVPFSEAPEWVRQEWQAMHEGARPRVRVYRTTVAQIPPPTFEYAVRDIVAHKAGSTMRRYVPAYESLLAATPQQKALYFGGAVKLDPDEAIAVMDYWGGRYQNIDLYVHPEAYEPPKLLAPTLTERQKKLLATVRAYIPAYRKEVFHIHKVTEVELEELKKMGLVDQRGAITVLGRNVIVREEPWSSYLPQAMPRSYPEKSVIVTEDFLDNLQSLLDESKKAESLRRLEAALNRLTSEQRQTLDGLGELEQAIKDYKGISRQGLTPEEYQEEKESAWGEIEDALGNLSLWDGGVLAQTRPLRQAQDIALRQALRSESPQSGQGRLLKEKAKMPLGSRLISPAERQKAPKEGLQFFADSADHCCNSMDRTGMRPQLDKVFQEAIVRAKGGSR